MDGEERIPSLLHFYYWRLMYFGNFPQFPLYYEFCVSIEGIWERLMGENRQNTLRDAFYIFFYEIETLKLPD